jgi:hypothetical protein
MTATTFIGVSVRSAIAKASGLHSDIVCLLAVQGGRDGRFEIVG